MKKISAIAFMTVVAIACLTTSAQAGTESDQSASQWPKRGLEAATAITKVTGVAMSPLLGTSVLGAWDYMHASKEDKAKLDWYARPLFWLPALLVVGLVAAKDSLGAAFPVGWKKPIDVAETIENKVSGLVAAGAFAPIVSGFFHSQSANAGVAAHHMSTSGLAMVNLATIDLTPLLNILSIPLGIVAFVLVWMVSHVITVLILVSPFGVVDGALKAARTAVIASLATLHLINPWIAAGISVAIVVIAYFVAGWSFRMMIYGSVFTWDFLTIRRGRFKPAANANWMFTARRIEKTPIRSYGKLIRGEKGELTFEYRPWLFMQKKTLTLPQGKYAVGRGLLYPEIMTVEGEEEKTMLLLPPRYKGHESDLAHAYNITDIRDVGLLKGFKAIWNWMKNLCGFRTKPVAAAAPA